MLGNHIEKGHSIVGSVLENQNGSCQRKMQLSTALPSDSCTKGDGALATRRCSRAPNKETSILNEGSQKGKCSLTAIVRASLHTYEVIW